MPGWSPALPGNTRKGKVHVHESPNGLALVGRLRMTDENRIPEAGFICAASASSGEKLGSEENIPFGFYPSSPN
jgi:hypothetical protein